MNNRKTKVLKDSPRRARIKHLSQQIAALTKELDALLLEKLDNDTESTVKVADKVVITNNYRGLQGRQGIVTKVTNKQATITLDDGTTVQRSKNNIKKVK
jgi:hypothetical protein